jgi:hypothetical protein
MFALLTRGSHSPRNEIHSAPISMACCPWCQRGALRIIAAITHGEVIRKILRHLKLAVDPPPIAPARVRQAVFAWFSV